MNRQEQAQIEYYESLQKLPWYEKLTTDFVEFVGARRGISALCVQSGPGLVSRKLAKAGLEVTALDNSRAVLDSAAAHAKRRRLRNISHVFGDAADMPFPDGSFDLVIAVTLIGALEHPQPVLDEIARVAVRGGMVATLDPSVELRPERVLFFATRNALTGPVFKAFQAWCAEAVERERFSVLDIERLYRKAGLTAPETEEQMDRILLAAKAFKAS